MNGKDLLTETAKPIYSKYYQAYTENDFWCCMNGLAWPDRSDRTVNIPQVRSYLHSCVGSAHTEDFKKILSCKCDALRDKLSDKPWFVKADPKVQMDVLAHVVCKGRVVYLIILQDPDFCEYIMHEYQSFWSCISRDSD